MARRKKSNDDEDGGLDSLLDTMTNVVGILIIVLVVTQLGVQSAVNRIASSVQVDPGELEKVILELEEKQKERQDLEDDLDTLDPDKSKLEDLIKRLQSESTSKNAVLESKQGDLKKALVAQAEIETARKEAEKNKKLRNELSKELGDTIDKIAKLEATLDDTPPRDVLPAKVVNLPNPRPAPDGIKQLTFIVTGNQVYPLSIDDLRKGARKRAEFQARSNLRRFLKDPKDPSQGLDGAKFVKEFNERRLTDDFFRAEMYDAGGSPRLRLEPKSDGYSVAEIENPRSRFARLIRSIDPSKAYFRFLVMPDSYDAYVSARRVVDEAGFLAGWQPQGETWKYTTSLGGELRFGPKPKNDKPAPPKPTTKPNVID